MNLSLPSPTVTDGPEWAEQLNDALEVVDDHDHSSGKGKKVTPAGFDVNDDLDVQEHALLNVDKVNLVNQDSALSGVSNACTVSFANGNFYITNSGGIPVQVTDGTQVVSTVVIPSSPLMPAGTVLDYAGITVPPGFLAADGSAVSRTTYSDLFNALGTSFGVGDGSSTFNLPNFNGRTAVGSGSYNDAGTGGSVTRSLGQSIGASVHTLTSAEMPSHTHTQNSHNHLQGYGGSASPAPRYGIQTDLSTVRTDFEASSVTNSEIGIETSSTTATNQNTGGGGSHNNMQPSLVINKIIKY